MAKRRFRPRICKRCDKTYTGNQCGFCYLNSPPKDLKAEEERLLKNRAMLHGITLDEAKKLVEPEKCEICKQTVPKLGTEGAFDHDHATGKLRGFLCSFCNRGLGFFRDSPSILEAAATYLRKNGKD